MIQDEQAQKLHKSASTFVSLSVVDNWNSLPLTRACRRLIPACLQERQTGDHLARQEVSSPSFAHPRSDLSVESSAKIVLGWQQPNLKAF